MGIYIFMLLGSFLIGVMTAYSFMVGAPIIALVIGIPMTLFLFVMSIIGIRLRMRINASSKRFEESHKRMEARMREQGYNPTEAEMEAAAKKVRQTLDEIVAQSKPKD